MSVKTKLRCSECVYSTWKQSHLSRHFLMHTGERPFACQFPGCTSTFTSQSHLVRHVCIHTGQKSFSCPHTGCTASIRTNSNLKTHLRIHSGEKPFTCNLCLKQFRQRGTLDVHIRTHTGEKPYKCQVKGCFYSYANLSNLISHQRVHSGEEFKCPVPNCPFSTLYKHNLKRHQMRHSQKKALALRPLLKKSCEISTLTKDPKLRTPAFVILADVVRRNDAEFKQVPHARKIAITANGKAKSKEVQPENVQLTEKENDDEEVLNVPQNVHKTLVVSPSNKSSRQSNVGELELEAEKKVAASPEPLSDKHLKEQEQIVDSVERRRVFKFYTVVFCPVVLSEGCVRKFRFFCHLCPKQFDKEMQVLTHLRKHTGHDIL